MKLGTAVLVVGTLIYGAHVLARDAKIRVGDSFPSFKLPHLYGTKTFASEQLNGKVAVIDFWGSDCLPCREAVPELNSLSKEFEKKPVIIVGINVDENEKDTKAFLDEFKPQYLLLDDGKHKFIPKMGIELMPTTYVIGKAGRVQFINKGFRSGDIEKIRAAIRRALSDTK